MKKNILKIAMIILTVAFLFTLACVQPGGGTTKTTVAVQSDLAIGYKVVGSDATYFVFINADTVSRIFDVDQSLTSAVCVVDPTTAGTTAIANPTGYTLSTDGKTVTVDAVSGVILKL